VRCGERSNGRRSAVFGVFGALSSTKRSQGKPHLRSIPMYEYKNGLRLATKGQIQNHTFIYNERKGAMWSYSSVSSDERHRTR
jgi:hypothetical protein